MDGEHRDRVVLRVAAEPTGPRERPAEGRLGLVRLDAEPLGRIAERVPVKPGIAKVGAGLSEASVAPPAATRPRPARSARRRGRPCRARRSGCSRGRTPNRTRGTPPRGSCPSSFRITVSCDGPTAGVEDQRDLGAVVLADREAGDVPLAEPVSADPGSRPGSGRSAAAVAIDAAGSAAVDPLELDDQRAVTGPC